MTKSEFSNWLDRFGRTWEQQDPDAVVDLFTPDGTYAWGPFNEPIKGRDAIHAAWVHATQGRQQDIHFGHEVLAVTGDRGIARWWASMTARASGRRVRMEGICLVTLAADGRCTVFREWWNEDPPATGASEYG